MIIGLIGIGKFGRKHASKLKHLKNNKIINDFILCDINRKKVDEEAAFYNVRKTYDYQDLTKDEFKIDAVQIVTESETHYEISKYFLEHNIPVFVEKPIAMTSQQARELKNIASECGLILMTGLLLRYHPSVRTIKKMIDQEEFGNIFYIYAYSFKFDKPRKTEGTLHALAIHNIDLVCYLLSKQKPSSTFANLHVLPELKHDWASHITLKFEKGTTAYLFQSWLTPTKFAEINKRGERGIKIIGERMSAQIEYKYLRGFINYDCQIPLSDFFNRFDSRYNSEIRSVDSNFLAEDLLEAEIIDFVSSIEKKRRPINSDHYYDIDVLEIIEKSIESNSNGCFIDL